MQLFGKELFTKKAIPTLYDFAQHGILHLDESYGVGVWTVGTNNMTYTTNADGALQNQVAKKPAKKKPEAPQPTPKDIFELKTLNTPGFSIKTDKTYLDHEILVLEDKLELYPKPRKVRRNALRRHPGADYPMEADGGAVHYGKQEVQSMIERLGNRQKLAKSAALRNKVNTWPHTTNDAIRAVLSDNKHLEAIQMRPMLPDLPSDAVKAMKAYKELTVGLCNKEPVFYLIRERAKSTDVARKRDPILLAQSPFGFFWQILGAWDKEVVLLDEL